MDFRRTFRLLWQLWNIFCVISSFWEVAAGYPRAYPMKNSRAYACQDSYIYLNCTREGERIRIRLANYGRFSLVVCNQEGIHNGWDLQCSAELSNDIVKEKCDGRKNCTFLASNSVFGDPCPGTKKYIEIRYYCEKVNDGTSTTTSKKMTKPATVTAAATTATTAATDTTTTTTVVGGAEKWGTNQVCASTERGGVFWPATLAGEVMEKGCPYEMTGSATWLCGTNRKWRGKPDLTDCISSWMHDIQTLVDNNAPAVVPIERLNHRMGDRHAIGPGDLKLATTGILPRAVTQMKSIMREMTKAGIPLHEKRDRVHSFTKEMVRSGSFLLASNQSEAWRDLRASDRRRSASSLIVSLQQLALEVAATIIGSDSLSTTEDNILMEVSVMEIDNTAAKQNLKLPLKKYTSLADSKDEIMLPMDGFKGISDKGPVSVSVTFLYYKNIEEFLSPGQTYADNHNQTVVINTRVMSASVNKHHSLVDPTDWPGVTELSRPMNFTLEHKQVFDNYKPLCSFWDFNKSLEGGWSQEGCRVVATTETETTCQCDHLTNFAILMDVSGTKLSRMHELTLRAITYVGCVVSVFCLFMCFVSFSIFPNLQSDRNTIHKNLVLCLFIAELLFLFGIGQTEYKLTCSIIAAFLHFFFLTSFSWMCLEGIQLYFMLIEVFEAERSRVRWFYLFGYGTPAFIVIVSALADHTGYGTDAHCWLRTDNLFILSFVMPAAIVILINIAMLSIAVYMMCRHANVNAASIQKRQKGKLEKMSNGKPSGKNSIVSEDSVKMRREMPTWLKGSAVLVVLLGLTWSFGLLYVNEDTIAMAYIFTILNSLQGLFIFIFHCFMDRKVKKEWRKAIKKTTWLPMCLRVNVGGYAGNLSSPSPSSSSGPQFYFLRFWSSRRRKRSSTCSISNKHQRSDIDSFLVDSSSGGTTKTGLNRFSDPSDHLLPNGHNSGLPVHYEGGVHGDLSVVDASVIDSEYVTEYCQHNMLVSKEKRRYSSGSEDEDVKDNVSRESTSKHRLSYLSTDSDFQSDVKSDFASDYEELNINYAALERGDVKKMPVYENTPIYENTNNITESDKNLLNNLLNYVKDEMLTPLENYDEQGFKKGLVPDDSNVYSSSRDKLEVKPTNDNKALSAPDLQVSSQGNAYGNPLMDTTGQPLLGSVPHVPTNHGRHT